jgi:hypothetical protein
MASALKDRQNKSGNTHTGQQFWVFYHFCLSSNRQDYMTFVRPMNIQLITIKNVAEASFVTARIKVAKILLKLHKNKVSPGAGMRRQTDCHMYSLPTVYQHTLQ